MAISIWAVMSEEIWEANKGGQYISTQTEQIELGWTFTCQEALALAKKRYPDAIRYIIGESSGSFGDCGL